MQIDRENKERRKARQEAEEAFQRELANARSAAMQFFDEQKKRRDAMRADVAKGPGAGIEVGSAEAAKFAADQVNNRIADKVIPQEPALLQRDLVNKTVELLLEQRAANARADRQIALAENQLKEMQENGFRRIR